jgi:hypothetical protein
MPIGRYLANEWTKVHPYNMKRAYGSGESASLQALAKAHLLPYLSHALLLVDTQSAQQQARPVPASAGQ